MPGPLTRPPDPLRPAPRAAAHQETPEVQTSFAHGTTTGLASGRTCSPSAGTQGPLLRRVSPSRRKATTFLQTPLPGQVTGRPAEPGQPSPARTRGRACRGPGPPPRSAPWLPRDASWAPARGTHQALLRAHERPVDSVHLVVEAAGVAQVVAGAVAAPQRCGQGPTVDTLATLAGELLQDVWRCGDRQPVVGRGAAAPRGPASAAFSLSVDADFAFVLSEPLFYLILL